MLQVTPAIQAGAQPVTHPSNHNEIASNRGMAFHYLVGLVLGKHEYWRSSKGRRRVHLLKELILGLANPRHGNRVVRRFVGGRRKRMKATWLAHALDDLLTRIDAWGLTDIRVEKQLPIFVLGERYIDVGAPDINGLLPCGISRVSIEIKTGENPNFPGVTKVNNYTLGSLLEYKARECIQPLSKVVWLSYSVRSHRHENPPKYTLVPHVTCTEVEVNMQELSDWTLYHYNHKLAYIIRSYLVWFRTPRHLRRYPPRG